MKMDYTGQYDAFWSLPVSGARDKRNELRCHDQYFRYHSITVVEN